MRRSAIPLAGAAILVAFALTSLPWSGLLRRPATPFDRSLASFLAPGYALLREAAAVIPRGASVAVRTEPPDPVQETWYHRFAVSLLPGRRALPMAFYGARAAPETWREAEYFVIVGPRPAETPGALVLETAAGTVWRRQE